MSIRDTSVIPRIWRVRDTVDERSEQAWRRDVLLLIEALALQNDYLRMKVRNMATNESDLARELDTVEAAEGDAEQRVSGLEAQITELESQLAAGAVTQADLDRLAALGERLTALGQSTTPTA